jgi:hypothetical protein
MGFFKNIFKRKKGGTKAGNFLRGLSSGFTGGVLGSGKGLEKWEAEQRAQIQPLSALQTPQAFANTPMYQGGQSVVSDLLPKMAVSAPQTGSNTVGQSIMRESLKKKWHLIALVAGALVWATYFITNRSKGGRRR